MKIIERPLTPNPPNFPKFSSIAFRGASGEVYSGTFLRRTSNGKAGVYYKININGDVVDIFANGEVGRTVTKQEA